MSGFLCAPGRWVRACCVSGASALTFPPGAHQQDDPKPALSHENLVLNELIREYLEYNHYKHTLSVFTPETGQPAERINRTFLSHELGLHEDTNSRQVPLLYSVLARLQNKSAAAPAQLANTPFVGSTLQVSGGGRSAGADAGGRGVLSVSGGAMTAGGADVRAVKDPPPLSYGVH